MINERKLDMSVIVVAYNQPQTLKLILRSLLAQNFTGSYEIIVCDDGSRQELFSQCRELFDSAKVPTRYIWQQDRYFRAGAARNNGIALSRGRCLLFLDGDMIPALDAVKIHIEAHSEPKLLVAGNRKWRGKLSEELACDTEARPIEEVLHALEYNWVVDEKTQRWERGERKLRQEWLDSAHSWRACFSGNVSVEWSPEVQFDENFIGWGPEDWEFDYRLCVRHGYTPIYRDDITSYHLETPEAVSNVFRRNSHEDVVRYLRNTFYFFDKCPGLTLEEVFFGIPRFQLDPTTNTWQVIPRSALGPHDLGVLVQRARHWLMESGIYP